MSNEEKYEVQKTLVLSTRHLPDCLIGPAPECSDDVSIVDTTSFGWRLYAGVNEEGYGRLTPAVKIARSIGCTWIEFDRDGPEHTTLPRWDDEGTPIDAEGGAA